MTPGSHRIVCNHGFRSKSVHQALLISVVLLLAVTQGCSSDSDSGLDSDADRDMIADNIDNCPAVHNPDQASTIGNFTTLGDACDDEDADAVVDASDNCPLFANADQLDTDGNGIGDACDSCGTASKVGGLMQDATSNVDLAVLGERLYFSATDEEHGAELWSVDATDVAAEAERVADIAPGSASSHPGGYSTPYDKSGYVAFNGSLYFQAHTDTFGWELWKYDPATGATLVDDILPGSGSSYPGVPTVLGGRLYFAADDENGETELWMYNPNNPAAGSIKVADINPTSGSNPRDLLALEGKLYFFAGNGKIWAYEPDLGASVVADLMRNAGSSSYADQLTALDGKLYFRYWGNDNFGIWMYNPASPDIAAGPVATLSNHFADEARDLTVFNGKLYFTTYVVQYGRELWVYDPGDPTAGAALATDIFPGAQSGRPSPEYQFADTGSFWNALTPTELDGVLYLNGNDGVSGFELMAFDPAAVANNTRLVADSNVGPDDGDPMNLTAVNGKLYFMANDDTNDESFFRGLRDDELWMYDPACSP